MTNPGRRARRAPCVIRELSLDLRAGRSGQCPGWTVPRGLLRIHTSSSLARTERLPGPRPKLLRRPTQAASQVAPADTAETLDYIGVMTGNATPTPGKCGVASFDPAYDVRLQPSVMKQDSTPSKRETQGVQGETGASAGRGYGADARLSRYLQQDR